MIFALFSLFNKSSRAAESVKSSSAEQRSEDKPVGHIGEEEGALPSDSPDDKTPIVAAVFYFNKGNATAYRFTSRAIAAAMFAEITQNSKNVNKNAGNYHVTLMKVVEGQITLEEKRYMDQPPENIEAILKYYFVHSHNRTQ